MRALAAVAAAVATLALSGATAPANADTPDTVALTEVQRAYVVDALPLCQFEDCSDVAAITDSEPGLWRDDDTGNWYLTYADRSLLIVDDTAR